jgi:apolipoprotein N-acyltransferase
MLHNGWFKDMRRRLSELAKNAGRAPKRSDDDPLGDDAVAEGGHDPELDEGGRHSARHGPERGDI